MINETYRVKYYFKSTAVFEQKGNLSLFFSPNSLIFCQFTQDYAQIIELGEIEFDLIINPSLSLLERLKFVFANYQLIKPYQKVYISILNLNFALIPTAFANTTNSNALLQFTIGSNIPSTTIENNLNNFKFCFTLEQDLKQYLEKTFSTAFISHAGAVNLNLFINHPNFSNTNLLLIINYNSIEIAVKHTTNLKFYNVFNVQANEDIIYYLLFTLEQLSLNPITVNMVVAGQIVDNSTLINSLKKYIKHINFIVTETPTYFKNELKNVPEHFYFTVLNQHLCEL